MRVFAFEDIDPALPLMPLAARRALDVAGQRLSLKAWQHLPIEARRALVLAGSDESVPVTSVKAALADAVPRPDPQPADDEARLAEPPAPLRLRLGVDPPAVWARLRKLERFALWHVATRAKTARIDEALAEILAPATLSHVSLSHIDERGQARMVDVGPKTATHRTAVAGAVVRMRPDTAGLLAHGAAKGDVLAAARIAGIMAAKRTSELIPLCHPLALTRVTVDFEVDGGTVRVRATAEAHDRTGVEMEAMTAASIAALTIYDMLKAAERGITIDELALLEKTGGRSGHYKR
jgi:molybdenum cofactor biosynthesis protein MoaC